MSFYRKQTELDGAIRHELLGCIQTGDRYQGNPHSHPFAETLYVSSGHFTLESPAGIVELSQGGAVIIRPQVRHCVHSNSPSVLTYIGCSYIRFGSFLPFPEEDVAEITSSGVLEQLRAVAEAYQRDDTDSSVSPDISALLLPLDTFWRSLAAKDAPSQSFDILMERVKEYLALHPREQISVGEIAETFYISPHYLGNKFCKYTGMTIKQYHSHLRMNQALSLLEDSALSLSEIAEQLGFNTPQYFSSCFKAHFGISPRSVTRKRI